MTSVQCKATTKTGKRCKHNANASGYCHIHDPERIVKQKAKEQDPESFKFEMPIRSFSERRGYKPVSEVIQHNSMSPELRNSLWNVLSASFLLSFTKTRFSMDSYCYNGKRVSKFAEYLWVEYFKRPLDYFPITRELTVQELLTYFQKCKWHEAYDFLEVTINYFRAPRLVKQVNSVLERELSGYRFVGGVFTDITSDQEIEMLEQAIDNADFPAVSSHLKRALALLSDRDNPDYRNSIKESISAVESLAKTITGRPKATLGDALKALEASSKLHPALKKSFLSLYGYTSDEEGIRHAMLSESNLTAADAKFLLLSCTSFIT